ncbi:MAG: hypothetical protein AAGL24_19950 [Pseudomonadota bacterium]
MPFDKILFFVIIYGVGTAVLIFLTHILREAGNAAGGNGSRTASRMVMALWLWAAIANAYALLVIGDTFLWFVPSVVLPLVVGFSSTFMEPVRHVLRHISLAKLIIVQVYRNAGAVFLIAYYVTGTYMSKEFADNAGWGDVLTGMLAIPTALAALYRIPFWRLAVIVWCAIGIGDLILAPVTAQIYGGMRSDDFPINAIPIFFGPPLGILLHLVALRALALQRETQGPHDGLKTPLARPEAAT